MFNNVLIKTRSYKMKKERELTLILVQDSKVFLFRFQIRYSKKLIILYY